ncbi:MAG: ABC transporter ATP-binding protein, partial [Candidatus Aenigmarchaeota archaeon]|nr:ABC transporter ATP-binding protein [Candidatus Aenigmarchaeota archaeon]
MNAIQINNLSFFYENENKTCVLNNINLSIKKRDFAGIIGATGSGKTTFALCLNGLIPNSINGIFSGTVKIKGISTKKARIAELSKTIGLVFQDPDSQLFALTVFDEVLFGPENLGLDKNEIEKRANNALKMTGIYDLKNRETHSLSDGQKQKVCIASILAMDPEILVLDEPTAKLDYKSTKEIYEILRALNKKGKTIILIEHKVEWLYNYANRIIVMNNSNFELDGKPNEIFKKSSYL